MPSQRMISSCAMNAAKKHAPPNDPGSNRQTAKDHLVDIAGELDDGARCARSCASRERW